MWSPQISGYISSNRRLLIKQMSILPVTYTVSLAIKIFSLAGRDLMRTLCKLDDKQTEAIFVVTPR